ncbi:DUF3486 family protein [Roseibium litorale]|uniref:DUF3486 family protein n=1 Tax=Roseibium litorale TaxID=2803841 RepID=A0ABR9CJA3_9HYPH|nr:DUF3486 family protein [Roseibium litorale]MBD8890910.1 DUF3486 family protein [Roseibium litorale]
MSTRRTGRGQLSSIERLPSACDEIIVWAANELRLRERTQKEIYEDFYAKLEDLKRDFHGELDFTIPSLSSFNRYSLNQARLTRRLEDTRAIAASISDRFDAEASDDLTLIAAEAIKALVFEHLTDAGEGGLAPKSAMDLANALRSAVAAQGISTKRRAQVEADFAKKTDAALEKVAGAAGLTSDTIAKLRREFLGLRE